VRINPAGTDLALADLEAVAEVAYGIRIPKVESTDEIDWVATKVPGKPLICAIESARGVVNAFAIADHPAVTHLALGGIDLRKDLGTGSGDTPLQYVRSHLVVAARAAGIAPPIDSVYPYIDDIDGLTREGDRSRELGFFGKSAVHPAQVAAIHTVFTPRDYEIDWARKVLDAFDTSGGAAVRLPGGEFVDLPVAERARRILRMCR